jgi:hypothetical protein
VSIVAPGFTDERTAAVGSWQPTRFTRPLCGCDVLGCGHFPTEGDKLVRFVGQHFSIAEAAVLELDPWQPALLRAILEKYPDDWPVVHLRGQLRYRQVVISMGRQNGKSLLGAILVLYFLVLHLRGPNVIGLASIDKQAKIVYRRVKYAIDQSPALRHELKTTNTRGISRKDGSGLYQTLPAKEDSAQGEPGTGILYDELHLGLAALWDAMVLAQRAHRNSLMVGITTAGDDGSELLVRLYAEGENAIAGQDERFGFFLWEALTNELTEENVIMANPSIACGRVPLDVAMSDAQKMWNDTERGPDGLTGRQRAIRYTLNRFIQGAVGAWLPVEDWTAKSGQPNIVGNVVYGIERTESWGWASITATTKHGDQFHTELVASLQNPTLDSLEAACVALAQRPEQSPTFAMRSRTLGDLAMRLRNRGMEAWRLGATEEVQASQHAAAVIKRPAGLVHSDRSDQGLVKLHVARGRRREAEGGWRLSQSLAPGDTDALWSTVAGLYVADQLADGTLQLY